MENFCKECGSPINGGQFCGNCGKATSNKKGEILESTISRWKFKEVIEKVGAKKIGLLVIAVIVFLVILVEPANGNPETEVLKVAENYFTSGCEGIDGEIECEVGSFYETDIQLVQREDEKVNQHGIYNIRSGLVLTHTESEEKEYIKFDMDVLFLNGEFRADSFPLIGTDSGK